MTRVKRGAVAIRRHKKVLALTKGFRGSQSKLFRTANQQMMKSLRYAYIHRRTKKREYRKLWIQRINSASRLYKLPYSLVIHQQNKMQIRLNRKILAQLSILDPDSFEHIIKILYIDCLVTRNV